MNFSTVENLIDDLTNGKMIILVDDEDRENEGDLVFAADFVTSDKINFLAHQARGLICLALAPEIVDRLELPLMVTDFKNGSPHKTAFTVSIEAADGISTGISTADRAHTIQVASDKNSTPASIRSPGHIFPLKAKANGVLERTGHTEASVDLMKLAGLSPAAVICEVMNDDGTMARLPDLIKYAAKYDLKIGKIEDLVQHRKQSLQKDLTSEISEKEIGI
jgi:3,4-dihydroxy 2-butanone 4-phosphate synthase/GTP cyclohydrolase II